MALPGEDHHALLGEDALGDAACPTSITADVVALRDQPRHEVRPHVTAARDHDVHGYSLSVAAAGSASARSISAASSAATSSPRIPEVTASWMALFSTDEQVPAHPVELARLLAGVDDQQVAELALGARDHALVGRAQPLEHARAGSRPSCCSRSSSAWAARAASSRPCCSCSCRSASPARPTPRARGHAGQGQALRGQRHQRAAEHDGDEQLALRERRRAG